MSGFRRALTAFIAVFRSFSFVRKHGLLPYFIIPGISSLVAGTVLAVAVFFAALLILEWLVALIPGSSADFLLPFLWIFAFLQAIFFYFISYRLIAAAVVLPFLGPMQDRLETIRFGQRKETTLAADVRNAAIGSMKALLQIAGMLLLLLISIPLGPFQSIVLALYDGYFMGRGIFDMMLERDFPEHGKRKAALQSLRWESLGLGLGSLALLLIPIFGILSSTSLGLIAAFRIKYGETD